MTAAVEVRRCANLDCRRTLTPHPGERPGRWRVRQFCDNTCRCTRGSIADRDPARHCQRDGCGKQLARNREESAHNFRTRGYCDQACRVAADRDGAAVRARERASTRPASKPKPVLSVFGDVAPAEPWRPATWR